MNKNATHKLLPAHPVQAVQKLIKISQALVDVAERETQALLQNDTLSFTILQDEKELLTSQYSAASEEFRGRLEDFRKIDAGLISQLEKVQQKLMEKSHSNNVLVSQMRQRAERTTQKTLITVQELGQRSPVSFRNTQQERL